MKNKKLNNIFVVILKDRLKDNFVIEFIGFLKNYSKYKINQNKKCLYLLGTTSHNNLGDHAISYAEIKFCQKYFKDYCLIEIPDNKIFENYLCLKKFSKSEDLIFLHGGGNMGVEYYLHEYIRQKIVLGLRKSKIIIFPQTLDYGSSRIGKIIKNKSIKIFNSNNLLCITTRDRVSFKESKKIFNKVTNILVPDIVLTLDFQSKAEKNREYILLCLRKDRESILGEDDKKRILSILENEGTVIEKDMAFPRYIIPEERNTILDERMSSFKKARFVVTDRLHGMIFSVITGTPCIAFSNYNHKIRGVYEWLSGYTEICFIEDEKDFSKFKSICKQFNQDMSINFYDEEKLSNFYTQIIKFARG